ncbi:MAG: Formamidopyrimidine-DNA glycosylase, partial [Candidatus Anoxychlamydiales bacterium]|nr:Formamidopyrimidine-DNA glycosylase [Candidatus Anoxychlamydiales bacterium]
MPELCEIEVIKNDLISYLEKNLSIISLNLISNNIIDKSSLNISSILNKKIKKISRKGKYLIFELSDFYYLIFHLRMTGHIFLKDKNYNIQKHDHFILTLSNNKKIIYYDPRKFGKIYLIKKAAVFFKDLAKDPFEMSVLEFIKKIKNSKKAIKVFLMDQKIISGIGNIYANETLYLSKIHPEKTSNLMNTTDSEVSFSTIQKDLHMGIK